MATKTKELTLAGYKKKCKEEKELLRSNIEGHVHAARQRHIKSSGEGDEAYWLGKVTAYQTVLREIDYYLFHKSKPTGGEH